MKFLCDSCKAKYRIADEKVAGKTVRMKCRKCGHQIEVRAAVTETSTSTAPPRQTAHPAPGATARPPRTGLATSLSATKPRPSSPSSPPGAISGSGGMGGMGGMAGLAGAFQRNVHDAPASVQPGALGGSFRGSSIELSVTDEWYVAINGVPVGPVRISELRRKAAVGAVTEESLCWQEGLEEWRPIRSIPDLAAIVREAGQGNRPSLISSPDARASAPSAPRQSVAPRASTPPRPMAPSAPSVSRSNVVPLRPAASSNMDDFGLGPNGGAAAAFAPSVTPAPAPITPVYTPAPMPLSLPPPTIDPFAVPPGPAAPYRDSILPDPRAPSMAPPPAYDAKRPGVPLWFWPILVLALGFGGGVAFVVFRPTPQPAPVVIQMPPTAQPTAPDRPDPPAAPVASAEPPPIELPTKPTKTGGGVASKSNPKTAAAGEEKKGLDLGNLVGGGGGPNVGPASGGGPGAGGGLDQAGVERVVAGHRAGVKRTCWERGGDQKSSVNVMVSAKVAPNGTVSSTSSSGDDPVVSKCIETQVKSWTFPAPGAPTDINIPFKFVRQ